MRERERHRALMCRLYCVLSRVHPLYYVVYTTSLLSPQKRKEPIIVTVKREGGESRVIKREPREDTAEGTACK